MNKQSESTLKFDRESCIACAMCVEACPAGVLDLQIINSVSGLRRFPAAIPGRRCTGCRSCETRCLTGGIMVITR